MGNTHPDFHCNCASCCLGNDKKFFKIKSCENTDFSVIVIQKLSAVYLSGAVYLSKYAVCDTNCQGVWGR